MKYLDISPIYHPRNHVSLTLRARDQYVGLFPFYRSMYFPLRRLRREAFLARFGKYEFITDSFLIK